MPKLIDADKVFDWLRINGYSAIYREMKSEHEVGTFEPTPVQPTTGTEILLNQQAKDKAEELSEEDIKEISGMLKQMKSNADSIASHFDEINNTLDQFGEVIK